MEDEEEDEVKKTRSTAPLGTAHSVQSHTSAGKDQQSHCMQLSEADKTLSHLEADQSLNRDRTVE